jgi:hypothetical protein
MENNLFRKSSLEKISRPDQLNKYLRILNPGIWIVLSGFFIIILAVLAWAFIGTIPDTLQIEGVAFQSEDGISSVYCYLPLSVAKRLSENMDVQVSPDYAPREEYGYIFGKIKSIGKDPVSEQDLVDKFGDIRYVKDILPQGIFVETVISLEKEGSGLKWSNKKGSGIVIEKGASCKSLIIIKYRKPYELIFNR